MEKNKKNEFIFHNPNEKKEFEDYLINWLVEVNRDWLLELIQKEEEN